jgi:ribosomal protein S18 acetylase RimI-like enzyme
MTVETSPPPVWVDEKSNLNSMVEELSIQPRIAVDTRYQRQGIGRMLLRSCVGQVKLPRMRLCVRTSNQQSISLYEKEGYQRVDVWGQYYSDDEDALVMEKKLRNTIR